MSNEAVPVTVRIMDKEFCISCPNDQRNGLLESASILDKKMREIRDTRKVIGTDRIAVMAALNIAHELVENASDSSYGSEVNSRIKNIQNKLESALYQNKQLEF